MGGLSAVMLPLILAGIGILTSIAGTFLVKVKDGGDPHHALNLGEFVSMVLLLLTYLAIDVMLPSTWSVGGVEYTSLGVFIAIVLGLGSGLVLEKLRNTTRGQAKHLWSPLFASQ